MPAQPLPTTPFLTSSDLVTEVLASLGVAAAGQTISPEDFNFVAIRLDAIFRKLGALEIVYVADPQNIPGEWFLDIVAIVAGEVAAKFGAGPEFVQMGLGVPPGVGAAAMSLKIILRGRPTGEPQRVECF
jgi:hypothetical protein